VRQNAWRSTWYFRVVQGGKLKNIAAGAGAWLVVITAAHLSLNVDWNVLLNDRLPAGQRKLNVAYIPVT